MPRKPGNLPAYFLHRGSGQAVVRICGNDHYFGPHASPESRQEYDRLIAEWLANGRNPVVAPQAADASLLVSELLVRFTDHAESYSARGQE